jgi:hypothetical protein
LLRFEDLSIILSPTNPEIGTNLYMRVIPRWIASQRDFAWPAVSSSILLIAI